MDGGMCNVPRLAAVLLVALAAGCAARAEDANWRTLHAHNLLRHAGYGGLGPISTGEVGTGESRNMRATLAAGACYVLAVFGSDGFDDVGVSVSAPDGSQLAEDRTVGTTAVVSFCTQAAGEHQVVVTAGAGSGPFQLAYWQRTEDQGTGLVGTGSPGDTLVLGRPTSGMLPPGDAFVDYALRIPEPRPVTIDLVSEEFDCYLYLLRDGIEIDRDDDGGGGLNSRLELMLDPGTYTIRVGSYMNSGSGSFTLTAR